MSEVTRTVIDGFALGLCFLAAIGALVGQRGLTLRLLSLGIYGLMALAIASCAAPQSPIRETSAERCADMVDVYCAKSSTCFGVSLSQCLAYKSECAGVEGITQHEAETCSQAMTSSACTDSVPLSCIGIADTPSTTDPDRKTL